MEQITNHLIEIAPGVDTDRLFRTGVVYNRLAYEWEYEKSFYTYAIGMVELNGDNVEGYTFASHQLSNWCICRR